MSRRLSLAAAALLLGAALAVPALADLSGGTVVRRDAAATSLGTGEYVMLTPPGSAAVSQMRLTENAGYRTPLHVHPDTDEAFYVLEGRLTLFMDGQTRTLEAGDQGFVPRGTPHAQGNLETDRPVVLLLTMTPGAFSAFFDECAELVKTIPPGHPDYGARVMDMGKRHDIKVLGPPPF